jgi:hypothetical protein
MKSSQVLTLIALILWMWAVDGLAAPRLGEIRVNADVQEQFYAKYPDLKDEEEIVIAAARSLEQEGVAGNRLDDAALLAERARAILSKRTPQEWQRKAMGLFPELAISGSEFNALFLRHHAELQRTSPQFEEEPSWPVLLARRCADELKAKALAAARAAAPVESPPGVAAAASPSTPARRAGFWPSLLSFAVLLAIVALPARWLWRCRRAFVGEENSAFLWQQALGPAAWAYLAFAVIALNRTFLANADQGIIDRFGVSLLVALLAGLFLAVPAYGITLAALVWRRRRVPAPDSHA